ncbi:N-acyl homoserine lactonase family protein [Streptomyces sp. SID8352]|uniref:N-acyl homoserine lactonase family protein n=1 Tax=Streptomyces sp. SID8352 TaxID=2690338 RepID=UPI00139EE563|nr:MBL fold metallo-hydrolase [Streptomyces sp. SID8352]
MPDDDDLYELVVVRHGTRTGLRSEAYLSYATYGEPDGPQTTDYYLWVARNRSRTMLIDTGFAATPAARRGRTVLLPPATAYRELGVDVGAGHPVIITHAHWDHIGNLGLFPRSTFHIAQAELDFWTSEAASAPLLSHFAERDEVDRLVRLHRLGRVTTFVSRASPAPGIEVVAVGGHTPGQSMVTVNTLEGVVLLTSDVVHFTEELERRMPFISVTDLPGMYRGFGLVSELMSSGAVRRIVTGHDPCELDHLLRLTGPIGEHAGVIGALPGTPIRSNS